MNYQLKKIYLWPALKVSFFIFVILGGVIGVGWALLTSVFVNFLAPFLPQESELSELSGTSVLAAVISFISVYVTSGLILMVIACLVYNAIANWTGGFRVNLEKVEPEALTSEIQEEKEPTDVRKD